MSIITFPTTKNKSKEIRNHAELLSEAFKALQEQTNSNK